MYANAFLVVEYLAGKTESILYSLFLQVQTINLNTLQHFSWKIWVSINAFRKYLRSTEDFFISFKHLHFTTWATFQTQNSTDMPSFFKNHFCNFLCHTRQPQTKNCKDLVINKGDRAMKYYELYLEKKEHWKTAGLRKKMARSADNLS